MGVSERKKREREQKRSMILNEAEQLIREKGLDHLNMDEVAERAEVSKGSLYLYFNNKTDLVLAVCYKALERMNQMTLQVLTENKTGLEMVHQIGKNYLNFVQENPHVFSALRFLENYKDNDHSKESGYLSMCGENRLEGFRVMVRAIQIGMQDGSINNSYNAEELALLLWATSHGIVSIAHMHQHTEHFTLLDHLGLDLETMFSGYMKLIGTGIQGTMLRNCD